MEKEKTLSYRTSTEVVSDKNTPRIHGGTPEQKSKKINNKNKKNDAESEYYVFLNQKIKKLTTALYIVSDFVSDNEPTKWKLRELSVNLIGHISAYNIQSPLSAYSAAERVLLGAAEIISLLEVAFGARLISEMNCTVLREGYANLARAVADRAGAGAGDFSVAFDRDTSDKRLSYGDSLFLDAYRNRRARLSPHTGAPAHGSPHAIGGHMRGVFDPSSRVRMSYARDGMRVAGLHAARAWRGEGVPHALSIGHGDTIKDNLSDTQGSETDIRAKRKVSIFDALSLKGGEGMNIKDIVAHFAGVGEKTIQRDLNDMTKEGKVEKRGERRWRMYSVVMKK